MYGFVSSQVVNAATANVTQLRVSPINPSANAGVAGELKLELRNANNTNESLDSEATVVLSSDSITGQFAK